MPWKSDKQRKYMYSQHPVIAKKMEKHSTKHREYLHSKYSKKGK